MCGVRSWSRFIFLWFHSTGVVVTLEEGDWLVTGKGMGALPDFGQVLFLGLSAGYIGVFILWIFTKLSYFFRYFHYYCTLHWISWTNLYKWVMCFHKFLLMALHQMYWYQNIKFSSRKEGWESQGLTPLFQMSSISLVLQKATLGCRSWREWNMTCLRSTIYLEVELA